MPNTRHTLITARLNATRSILDEIIDHIPEDLADWTPAEGMRTFAGQLEEIICVEIPLVPYLKYGTDTSTAEADAIIGTGSSLVSLRQCMDEVRQQTLAYLDSLSAPELEEEVPKGRPWFGSLWLPTMPRAEFFVNIAEHEMYHVGQLTSYLWSRGDNPYTW